MNEFELIAALRRVFDSAPASSASGCFPVPNGDDAAVVRTASGMTTLTTDALVENVHFSFDLCSYADAGYRAAAVNLSDLAAMGSIPVGLLVSFVIPDRMGDARLVEVASGIAEAAARFGSPVAGGNITRTDGPFVISITAIGDQVVFPPPLRSGARSGDEIWVSGFIGDGALGLRVLTELPRLAARFPGLVGAWRRPLPRLDLVGLLKTVQVSAAIDVSDGLVADVGHIATDSGLMAVIDAQSVPLGPESRMLQAESLLAGFMDSVLGGGDDYQLVVVAPPSSAAALAAGGLHRIGFMADGSGVRLENHDGKAKAGAGWQHRH